MWYLWLALLILHVVLVQGLVNLHQLVSKNKKKNKLDIYNSCSDSSQSKTE